MLCVTTICIMYSDDMILPVTTVNKSNYKVLHEGLLDSTECASLFFGLILWNMSHEFVLL